VDRLNSPKNETKTRHGILNVERRKYPRFSIDLPIEYCPVDKAAGSHCRAVDISEGGLLLYLSERMQIGQRLRLKLFISTGAELNAMELLSEVAWVELHMGQDWGDYRTGVQFVDISPDDLSKLKQFLMSFSQPPYTR